MFKLTLLACLLASLICRAKTGEFHTSQNGDLFYVEQEIEVTWQEALDECSIQNMSLLTPDTEEKQLDISELISTLDVDYFWTAGVEINDMQFMWTTTGNDLTYSNWADGEPERYDSDNQCIGIDNNEWKSYNCINLKMFICEESLIKNEENHELDVLKVNASITNNQLEDSSLQLSNDMQELNESRKKLECDKHLINELDVLWKSYENNRENLSEDKQREINDLKNKNELYLNQLSIAKAELELKSKEIEMLKEFNEIQLRLLEDKYKMYTGFVDGILQVFKQLDKHK